MAYDPANPPLKTSSGIGKGVTRWNYVSADDHPTVAGADYFSNGNDLGMEVNDVVEVVDTATPTATIHVVSAVDPVTGAATIAAATLA